jgi:hypothetical protein
VTSEIVVNADRQAPTDGYAHDGDRLVSQSGTDGVYTSTLTYKYSCG